MNFFKFFFPQTHYANMVSDTNGNNIIATTIEKSFDQCHSQVDNNSNKLETESIVTVNTNDDTASNDSSVVSINEFGVTKTFHNLENVTPIEILPADKTTCKELYDNGIRPNGDIAFKDDLISNVTAEPSNSVNIPEDVLLINNNDLKEIQIPREAKVSNDATTLNDAIDDETMKNLEDFEEALNNLDKTALTDDVETDLINLDEFMEIFYELDPVSEEPIAKNDSENSICGNNENVTDRKEKDMTDTTNERHPNINENIDVISISSTEDKTSQTGQIKDTVSIYAVSDQSDSDDGYNSSDFEFISETEANMTGFVINYGLDNCLNLSPASSEPLINYCGQYFNREVEREPSDPGEGPSRQYRPRNEFEDRSYRNNHHIPEGDDYLGLFQGIYNPLLPMSEIYFLENKSVRASAMNSQYDGIGFDKQLALRRHQPDSSEDEFEDEAKESAKKILNMYPGENRKRRRRHF